MIASTPPPYKRTLSIDTDGDIYFDGSGKLVMTGTDNNKREQDISIFLGTLYGEDIFNPLYGLDMIAVKEAPFNKERIKYEIRNTIEQYRARADRPNRIKSINDIYVSDPDADRIVTIVVDMTADTDTISTIQIGV